jgi:hypothetical protein
MVVCIFERVQWRWALTDRLAPGARQQIVQVGGGRAVDLRQMRQLVVAEPWRTRAVRRELD